PSRSSSGSLQALLLVSARAAQQAIRVQFALGVDDLLGLAGQQAVADVTHHPATGGAEQPIVRSVRGGLVEADAGAFLGTPDRFDDFAHDILRSSSRRSFFEILPTAVVGKRSRTCSRSGSLNLAIRFSRKRKSLSSASVSVAPERSITHAHARSPRTSSETATTATFSTAGWLRIRFSTSSALIFSPPRLIRSFLRPSTIRFPLGRTRTMSPVR